MRSTHRAYSHPGARRPRGRRGRWRGPLPRLRPRIRRRDCGRRPFTAPAPWRSRYVCSESKHQFHERLRQALRFLRVQPRASSRRGLLLPHRGSRAACGRSLDSRGHRSLRAGRSPAPDARLSLHRYLPGHQGGSARDSYPRLLPGGGAVQRRAIELQHRRILDRAQGSFGVPDPCLGPRRRFWTTKSGNGSRQEEFPFRTGSA